ncbi:solute carrier family 35 member F5-like isoform X2 [Heterodontus francisci]|uniref:solute carrier family 35 member F5-like isoform X2 n=1 Tax=Heterodontus francisci TaxID=7792 RepID=UPI00355C897A
MKKYLRLQMVWLFIMNRMSSQGSSPQRRRMILGIIILLIVDIIWVVSSELTSYIFKKYEKPFFSTFAKTSMFVLYLIGFLVWKPWREQCTSGRHVALFADAESYLTTCTTDTSVNDSLSEPLYIPVKFHDSANEKANNDNTTALKKPRVRFSNIMEVRQLPAHHAFEAKLSRMSYPAAKDHEAVLKSVGKLTLSQVAKISFFFCFVWFLANLSYQEALSDTQVAIVNILSSTSGLFTLLLAAMFPSNSGDRFTLSKLLAVILSIGGVTLVSLSSDDTEGKGIIARWDISSTILGECVASLGSLWSLTGAVLYAVYIVMIKRKVDREDKLDIPMFFGFVGLFNLLLLWPGFFLLHYTGFEAFEFPTKTVWMYILINGLIGTVLSEFLWLCDKSPIQLTATAQRIPLYSPKYPSGKCNYRGCFLTSSLIGTLALSLTIPLSMIADIYMKKVEFSWLLFAGSVPVFLSFFIATLLCHYNNWDPVMVGLRRIFAFICRKHRIQRQRRPTMLRRRMGLVEECQISRH